MNAELKKRATDRYKQLYKKMLEPKKCDRHFQFMRPKPLVACIKCGEIPKEKLIGQGFFLKNLK